MRDNWLQNYNFTINWQAYSITFNSANCFIKNCLFRNTSHIKYTYNHIHNIFKSLSDEQKKLQANKKINICTISAWIFYKLIQRKNHHEFLLFFRNEKKHFCSIIINIIISTDYDKFMKNKSIYTWEKIMTKVSKKYHNKIEIFIKQKIDYLSSYCLKNLEIWLIKKIMLSFAQNYKSMIVEKLNAVKKYLNEHLEKNIICSSFSSAAALIFLTRKSDSDLKFCVNY